MFQDAQGKFIGFEYEFAEYLAKKLGRESVKVDADWSTLPELLDKPRVGDKAIDIVLNGYEQREDLEKKYAMTIPYYVYRLQLVAHRDADDINSWADLTKSSSNAKRKVGVLEASVAADYSRKLFGDKVEVLESKDVAIVFEEVKRRGRMDATVQDNPACVYFTRTMPELKLVGDGRQPSFYVIYLRKNDTELLKQLNDAIKDGLKDGTLQRIYTKYGLWNADQEWLCYTQNGIFPTPLDDLQVAEQSHDKTNPWPRLLRELFRAAGMTVFLAVASFPLAMFAGLVDRRRPRLRAGLGAVPTRGLRRGDSRHAAPVAAVLPLLHAPEDPSDLRARPDLHRHPRAGDQLLRVRGRELPRRIARDSKRADGSGSRARNDARRRDPNGHHSASDSRRHPAGHERLHRALQGHLGLFRHPHHGTDPEIQRTLQLQPRTRRRTGVHHGRAVSLDELSDVAVRSLVGEAHRHARGRRHR